MKYSNYTTRIDGEGTAAWDIHYQAVNMAANGEAVILLSMGDPDFDTPEPIIESAVHHLRAGVTHYTGFLGEDELRNVVAQQHKARTGCNTTLDNVVILSGAQCALYCAAQCILDAGDEVIVPEPTYVTYEGVVGATGATIVNVPLSPEVGYRINPEDIRQAITPKTTAIFLNSPHNPTGYAMSLEELEAIAEIAIAHDLWVISDEVYESLLFEQTHHSISAVAGMEERTIVVSSVSKSHAMSGWRIGWAIGPKTLCHHLGNMSGIMLYGCPPFSQMATVTALTAQIDELEQMRLEYKARRDLVYQRLNAIPALHCHLPAGGMFMMVDIRETGLTAQEFANELLNGYGVSVLAGEAFGPSAAGHIRLGLVMSQAILIDACNRIEACFQDLMTRAA